MSFETFITMVAIAVFGGTILLLTILYAQEINENSELRRALREEMGRNRLLKSRFMWEKGVSVEDGE